MEKSAFEKWLIRNYPLHEEMFEIMAQAIFTRNEMAFELMEKYAPGEPFIPATLNKVVSKLLSNDTDNPILPDIDEFTPDESDVEEAERQVRVNKLLEKL
jgi:hypothetical protein